MKNILTLLGISFALSATSFGQLSIDSPTSELLFSSAQDHHFAEGSQDLSFKPQSSALDNQSSAKNLTSFSNGLFDSLSGWNKVATTLGAFSIWTPSVSSFSPPLNGIATAAQSSFVLTSDRGSHLYLGFSRLVELDSDQSNTRIFPERISAQDVDSVDRELPWTSDPTQVFQPVSIADAYQTLSLSF